MATRVMTQGAPWRHILCFAMPVLCGSLLQQLYHTADTLIVGNFLGENALAAINLGLPILYFFLGIGLCVGVGGSVISGRLLGKQNSSENLNKEKGEI